MQRDTQGVLADRAELTQAHLSRIETGSTKLSLSALIRIANALPVSVEALLCDKAKPPRSGGPKPQPSEAAAVWKRRNSLSGQGLFETW
ncbi:helix-turn-helix transcriptional regulator [uncultured Intestinimonas sp.]|uniref:helix-turn-helix domain-containing protein n=1 Tax=uncultured Intestinimonas sp. TaxID=1689265 RepID=UPI00341A4F9B